MTTQRWMHIFLALGLGALVLGALGHWALQWPSDASMTWAGVGTACLLGALLFRLLPRWWREQCEEMLATRASKRYQRALWVAMSLYVLLLFGSIWLVKQGIESIPLRAVIATLPVWPLLLLLRAALRYLREIDELQRRIETEAIGIASLLLTMLYFGGGLLQKAQVIAFDAAVVMIWAFPLLCLGYGAAKMIIAWRYR